jgi:hypothetical protein
MRIDRRFKSRRESSCYYWGIEKGRSNLENFKVIRHIKKCAEGRVLNCFGEQASCNTLIDARPGVRAAITTRFSNAFTSLHTESSKTRTTPGTGKYVVFVSTTYLASDSFTINFQCVRGFQRGCKLGSSQTCSKPDEAKAIPHVATDSSASSSSESFVRFRILCAS